MRSLSTALATILILFSIPAANAAEPALSRLVQVGTVDGWAKSSVNTVIFRHSSIVSSGDIQYTAFYDNDARVVLAKRKLSETSWETRTTALVGNAKDAHNTISLGIDGSGVLHISWDHHANALNYVRSTTPGSLDLTEKQKTDGTRENQVTYPEFYTLPDGDLLLLYRVGVSGNGDLLLKRYHTAQKTWSTVQQTLISGENRQNAYPEFCVGPDGTLHLAWTWRRTGDVATNHNICYAKSNDGGTTWTDSAGKKLTLPITAATSETALEIPEKSDLINQTTITADAQGHPYIATYFRAAGETVPQLQIVYNDGTAWKKSQVGARTTAFSLAGAGTKRIPISRPLVLAQATTGVPKLTVIWRDIEHSDRVTRATTADVAKGIWEISDLTTEGWGSWEPSADLGLWTREGRLHLFVQKTDQLDGADGATRTNIPPTPVYILEAK